MSLVTFHTDLTRTADALERIAHCLELLLPPLFPAKEQAKEPVPIEKATNDLTYEYELNDQLDFWKDRVQMIMKEYGDELAATDWDENKKED